MLFKLLLMLLDSFLFGVEKQLSINNKIASNGRVIVMILAGLNYLIIGSPSGEPMFSLCRKWRKFAGHCKVT